MVSVFFLCVSGLLILLFGILCVSVNSLQHGHAQMFCVFFILFLFVGVCERECNLKQLRHGQQSEAKEVCMVTLICYLI